MISVESPVLAVFFLSSVLFVTVVSVLSESEGFTVIFGLSVSEGFSGSDGFGFSGSVAAIGSLALLVGCAFVLRKKKVRA